jgi:predicted RNA-binding Zn-ribbon protein involved in translation (DUF1610 family)
MYCYHCGCDINEKKIEQKSSTLEKNADVLKEDTTVEYVCPRCGHLIHKGESEEDIKSLARASHAEVQRGRNTFAYGMGSTCIGLICLALALVFYRLSYKPGMQNQFIVTCPEFYVCCVLFGAAAILLVFGFTFDILGQIKIHKYNALLKSIHNETFYQ